MEPSSSKNVPWMSTSQRNYQQKYGAREEEPEYSEPPIEERKPPIDNWKIESKPEEPEEPKALNLAECLERLAGDRRERFPYKTAHQMRQEEAEQRRLKRLDEKAQKYIQKMSGFRGRAAKTSEALEMEKNFLKNPKNPKKNQSGSQSSKKAQKTVEYLFEAPNWVKQPKKRIYDKPIDDFTKEELEEKKRKAFAEEAEKKAEKKAKELEKSELRWIELGKFFCDLKPEDYIPKNPPKNPRKLDDSYTGADIVPVVHNFVENLKKLLGEQKVKGTVFANCFAMTGALCNVNQKSVVYMRERIDRIRQEQEEAVRKEELAKRMVEDRYIEIGRAICSFTPEDMGIKDSEAPTTSDAPESSESDPQHILQKLQKITEPAASQEPLAWRGEDLVETVFHFSSGIRDMMGQWAKHTCFRSQFEFTSVFSNVAEKSVRDRYPVRKVGRNKRRRIEREEEDEEEEEEDEYEEEEDED